MTDLIHPIGPPDPSPQPVERIVKRALEDEQDERREQERRERERREPPEAEQPPPPPDGDEGGHVDVRA